MGGRRPVLIYDGDCGFCLRWIQYWKELTGDYVQYETSQKIRSDYPKIAQQRYDQSIVLVLPSGETFFGALAVFIALAQAPHLRSAQWILKAYRKVPFFKRICEWTYSYIARNRIFFSRLTFLLIGEEVTRSSYQLVSGFFLRGFGIIYFVAFCSLGSQIHGLVGSQGILSSDLSDGFIYSLCPIGMIGSLMVVGGICPLPFLILLGCSYSVLTQVCQEFLMFQWDSLLLEMGFLAIFFAPPTPLHRFWRKPAVEGPSSLIIVLLGRWLLFRVMFFSGWVKLMSGDPNWRNLSALTFHFETQPLPTWMSWYVHQLPSWVLRLAALLMFWVELVVPFLIFGPRRVRSLAFIILVGFQVLIGLTGNYGFFGWQVICLSILLLDDTYIRKWLFRGRGKPSDSIRESEQKWKFYVHGGVAALVLAVSLFKVEWIASRVRRWQIVNDYGVFAIMTTVRNEIVLEGSDDGKTWKEYEFHWKPGDLGRVPQFVAPHMPRLDWQMWFAALGRMEHNVWLGGLIDRLLQGNAPTLALLRYNPFPDHPPQLIRALKYRYHFSGFEQRRQTGQWWVRDGMGYYSPVFTLKK